MCSIFHSNHAFFLFLETEKPTNLLKMNCFLISKKNNEPSAAVEHIEKVPFNAQAAGTQGSGKKNRKRVVVIKWNPGPPKTIYRRKHTFTFQTHFFCVIFDFPAFFHPTTFGKVNSGTVRRLRSAGWNGTEKRNVYAEPVYVMHLCKEHSISRSRVRCLTNFFHLKNCLVLQCFMRKPIYITWVHVKQALRNISKIMIMELVWY